MRTIAILLLALTGVMPAGASILINFSVVELDGFAGDTLTYQGVLQNDGPTEVFLNGAEVSLPFAGFDTDASIFILDAPISLGPGDSTAPIDLFTVTIQNPYTGGGAGPFTGTFDIQGGIDGDAQGVVGEANFQTGVQGLPEPGAFPLVALGLAAFLHRRARHSGQ